MCAFSALYSHSYPGRRNARDANDHIWTVCLLQTDGTHWLQTVTCTQSTLTSPSSSSLCMCVCVCALCCSYTGSPLSGNVIPCLVVTVDFSSLTGSKLLSLSLSLSSTFWFLLPDNLLCWPTTSTLALWRKLLPFSFVLFSFTCSQLIRDLYTFGIAVR